ncbi:MAG: hypothetical protein IJW70_10625 [Clostridia bacterium]|nr:hypothetical protein [Clostridia bacterium]
MNKKQKIVLIIFCALLALLLIGALIGTVAMILSGNAHGLAGEWLTGYVNELREKQELEQIEREWEKVIQNENSDIAKIVMNSHSLDIVYSSSTIQPTRYAILTDEKQIDSVIDILSDYQMAWENSPKTVDELSSYKRSRVWKNGIIIELFDMENRCFIRLLVYEDGICEVDWDAEIVSDTHIKWNKSARAVASETLYQSLDALLNEYES